MVWAGWFAITSGLSSDGRLSSIKGDKTMKRKHHKDGNHGKRGWVSGNPRYNRAKANIGKNKSMGRN